MPFLSMQVGCKPDALASGSLSCGGARSPAWDSRCGPHHQRTNWSLHTGLHAVLYRRSSTTAVLHSTSCTASQTGGWTCSGVRLLHGGTSGLLASYADCNSRYYGALMRRCAPTIRDISCGRRVSAMRLSGVLAISPLRGGEGLTATTALDSKHIGSELLVLDASMDLDGMGAHIQRRLCAIRGLVDVPANRTTLDDEKSAHGDPKVLRLLVAS